MSIEERLAAIESKIDALGQLAPAVKLACEQASEDMHHPSDRPCPTCRAMTLALGFNWGCYAWQAKRAARSGR